MATLDVQTARRLEKNIQFLSENALRVGWISNPLKSRVNTGDADDKMRDDKGITTPTTVAQVARWHELGRGNNPERSMLKQTFIRKRGDISKLQQRAVAAVIERNLAPRDAMSLVGEGVLTLIKKRMVAGIPPPLSAARKRAKQRAGRSKDTPLINWGVMLNSVRYKIVRAQ